MISPQSYAVNVGILDLEIETLLKVLINILQIGRLSLYGYLVSQWLKPLAMFAKSYKLHRQSDTYNILEFWVLKIGISFENYISIYL